MKHTYIHCSKTSEHQGDFKIYVEQQRPERSQDITQDEEQNRTVALPCIKSCYNAILIKVLVQFCWKRTDGTCTHIVSQRERERAPQSHTYMKTQGMMEITLHTMRKRRNNLISDAFINLDKIKLHLDHTPQRKIHADGYVLKCKR